MIPTYNRELSWLAFNDRVLQEACDPSVPLMQRLRFLGIFSSNQDEFIKVRLAGLVRMARSKHKSGRRLSGAYLPADLLALVSAKIDENHATFGRIFQGIAREMEAKGIRLVSETQLTEGQRAFCLDYFANVISPRLVPLILNRDSPAPMLRDDRIYHGVKMEKGRQARYAVIRIPVASDCPRFIELPPAARNGHDIIFIDDVIRLCLGDIFFMFNYDRISAHTFKLMRDAEMTLDDDISTSLVQKMEKGLEARLRGRPVRLIYDQAMPGDLLRLLMRKLNVGRDQLACGARYHMMRDLMKFPRVRPDLEVAPTPPLPHPHIAPFSSLLKVIRRRDLLVNFPYHTFNHLVDFLREAAIDPRVSRIYISLYRTAENSKVLNTLVNAARNGKQVVALVELMARFDEEHNLASVETLERAGVKVLDGIRDLKVHGKLALVERREAGGIRGYAYVGTGNFNEDTARQYGDLGLLTADPGIVGDARSIFNFLLNTHKHIKCKSLLAAPYFMRKGFEQLIQREMRLARFGLPAYIHIKCNTLTDEKMIRHLYRAAQAGVEVRLIVRGACCLIPNRKDLSENIQAISIVDRFLEHARLFIFGGGGQEDIYISSADWMTRNLDKRLEVAVPILDANLRKTLRDFFDLEWADNVKARDLSQLGENSYVTRGRPRRVQSQAALYDYYSGK